ncbi:unnamed protein product, partial [Mesorhabditis belari]|uniref:Calx-beta domain-containing protein n=1 Tax=Mesorhabditis belari TaxID=2138241 RepID=A0AAF3J7A5_9BILA
MSGVNAVEQSGDKCAGAKPCSPGVILPVWTPPASEVSQCAVVFRAIVYLVALAYMFYGVSIVADRFMAAIEVITSQEREIKVTKKFSQDKEVKMIRVWNETVSNLTLMALGSSAPEILLSVIEIFGNNFNAGELGPSTIVGSAAFNLYVIIAICILSIPAGEVRRVQHNHVFWVTVIWSTFAYVWLYLILCVFSPNVVEVWEGALTFIFFPLTVASAYFADQHAGIFGRRFFTSGLQSVFRRHRSPTHLPKARGATGKDAAHLLQQAAPDPDAVAFEEHRKQYLEMFRQLRLEHPDAPIEELEKLATETVVKASKKSRAFYRIQATRMLTGQGDLVAKKLKDKAQAKLKQVEKPKNKYVTIEFDPAHYMCLESCGTVKLTVKCDRGLCDPNSTVSVAYKTVADTAQEESDFIATQGTLTFKAGVTSQQIEVAIVDNDVYEDDEQFLVRLSQVRAWGLNNAPVPVRLGAAAQATVLIVDDDHAGAFGFNTEKFKVPETNGVFIAEVFRTRGARGKVSIPYKTIDGAAKSPGDYKHTEGLLEFDDEQTKGEIVVEIVNDIEYEKNEEFYIELGEPIWHNIQEGEGAEGRPLLGDHPRCKVIIIEDKEIHNALEKLLMDGKISVLVGTSTWKQQFKDALEVEDLDEDGDISTKEKILHYISLPWKLLFALIPPTDYARGWICFFFSIFFIGLLTAVIGDLAAHFGCTVGLKDSVTAISLVAMGTSVPDTFASKTAAVQDKYADSSIGNVTGSNAVNVFLGIGIAWMIAAVYHAWNGTVFEVQAGALAFSVSLFLVGSVICIAILQFRRFNKGVQGELGGPVRCKYLAAFTFIGVWCLYLILCSLEAYCILPGFS